MRETINPNGKTYSAIDEVVKIFKKNRLNQLNVSGPEIGQSAVKVPQGFSVLFNQIFVVFGNIL